MFDGVLFDHYFNGEYCMGGNDVVFGDKVRDSSGQE
jgi:hypothetical protein